ncbi:MAG: hypothetical protein JWM42_2200 [Burkholderia sp.]|nr:hypothetical protein [Burkholderia sp.]
MFPSRGLEYQGQSGTAVHRADVQSEAQEGPADNYLDEEEIRL